MILAAIGPMSYAVSEENASITCNRVGFEQHSNIVLREPNGTRHHFSPDPVTDVANTCVANTNTVYADDGSGWIYQLNRGLLINKHGTEIGASFTVEDSNGNGMLASRFDRHSGANNKCRELL